MKSRKRACALAALGFIGFGAGFWRLYNKPGPLANAIPLASTQGWYHHLDIPYAWLSSQEVLHFNWALPDAVAGARRLNVLTHGETPLPELDCADIGSNLQVSRDRKHMLWIASESASAIDVVAPNASQTTDWHTGRENNLAVFMPDGRHWLTAEGPEFDGFLEIHTIGTNQVKRLPLGRGSINVELLGVNRAGDVIMADSGLDFWCRRKPRWISFTEYAIGSAATALRSWRVEAPGSDTALRGRLLLSPTADRLLWYIADDLGHPRVHPSRIFDAQTTASYHLWVSALDGSHLSNLGIVQDTYFKIGHRYRLHYFEGLPHWMPDGKAISFIYDQTLWKLSVP